MYLRNLVREIVVDLGSRKMFILIISDHQQRWPQPLPGAFLIPPALAVVADYSKFDNVVY